MQICAPNKQRIRIVYVIADRECIVRELSQACLRDLIECSNFEQRFLQWRPEYTRLVSDAMDHGENCSARSGRQDGVFPVR